ncbi:MAG: S1/P1 nuclease [Gammaproteobacteria bacterium]|nr:S1/P1 nuclease [Gammaproteobacteria bacterium]
MSRYLASLPLFFLSLFITPLFAWNALGHMIVAQIAYENLKPDVRVKVDDLVHHFTEEYPEMKYFQQLSYWPDTLRSQRIETFTRWHYIDVAFSKDGTATKEKIDTDNAAWAIKNLVAIVPYERANVYERARFLAFLIHIVGDLHQPLHTVTYFSAEHPEGDRGGNAYMIRYNNQRVKLHSLWDSGIENFKSDPNLSNAAWFSNIITQHYPKSFFGAKAYSFNAEVWVKEGMDNARTHVYNTPENQGASSAYIENAKKIAEQQVALAGYRLAGLLNYLFTPR